MHMHADATDLSARAVALGRGGMGRREIAAALGLTLAELAARELAEPTFADAMLRAEEAARAWWEGLAREALSLNARVDRGAWAEAMRRRFGEPAKGGEAARPVPEARFEFPDNGTRRKRPPRPSW